MLFRSFIVCFPVTISDPDNIPLNLGGITNGKTITITPETVKENEILLRVKTSANAREQTMIPSQIGSFSIQVDEAEIAVSKIPSGQTWYITAVYSTKRTSLKSYLLENLDIIRDKILLTPGDAEFDISNESMSVPPFTDFAKRTSQKNLNTTNPQFGLCLKTYNSDAVS